MTDGIKDVKDDLARLREMEELVKRAKTEKEKRNAEILKKDQELAMKKRENERLTGNLENLQRLRDEYEREEFKGFMFFGKAIDSAINFIPSSIRRLFRS